MTPSPTVKVTDALPEYVERAIGIIQEHFDLRRSDFLAAIGAGGQAMAWQYRVMFDEDSARKDEWCDWQFTNWHHFNSLNEQIGAGRKRVETRPLHTHPAPSGQAVAELHGPFGWLNGHRALSEDSWTLESDPLENSEEYFAIPLYALVDPFKEIGKDFDGKPSIAHPQPLPLKEEVER